MIKEQFMFEVSRASRYTDVPGLHTIRTLQFQSPRDYPYFVEQEITGKLGYKPVRKQMQESKVNSQEGLQAHLANMDLCVARRVGNANYLVTSELFRAIRGLEKSLQIEHKRGIDTLNIVTYKLTKKITEKLEKISEKIEGSYAINNNQTAIIKGQSEIIEIQKETIEELKKSREQKQQIRSWYQRIFGL